MEEATKESALKRITELVELFDEHYETYHRTTYDEAKTRGTFIDEFFKALGWDIHNKEGVDESYRDVIPEDKIKVEGRTKAPDYCFTIRGQRKFFVEAKKPSVPIKTDHASVFQLRRYGYHNKLPISIVSNFEEFAVYDCTKKPHLSDKTTIGRIRYIPYKEYVKEFDFIWNTFSKESVLKGRYDKFVKSDTEKRGTSTVDTDFLDSLNEWRKYLATSIAKNNHRLTQEEVQYSVQQTIDRIVFLIFCEYKNIEPFGNLKHASDKGTVYNNLFEVFNNADQKYNSGLFDFRKDKISEKLSVDNKVLRNIILDLYPPNSEYDFSILPVEVLGNAYEQFLGKVIRITPGHIVKIEDKPEVKKAGGVFYTPQYIVDYIVQHTIGKLIFEKTPEQISKIKILDPACGSGSFLLGAYQFLLNYHTNFYKKKGYLEKKIKNNPLTPEGRLTTEIKREILLNNIFGVDIDPQAVEVTKLSLLLKAMEGETEVSIKRQLQLVHERVLPNIDGNIKCGNSLIGHDFFEGQLDLDKEEKEELKKKINPFDWKSGFLEIFKQGGFDVVIGNPPYLKLTANNSNTEILSYYQKNYLSYSGGSSKNLFQLFIEKITQLSPKIFSFIIPEALLTTDSNGKVREILLKNFNLNNIVTFDHFVFQDATIGTCIFVVEKNSKEKTKIAKINASQISKIIREIKLGRGVEPWEVSLDDSSKMLFQKILCSSKLMRELVVMSKGMVVKDRNEKLKNSPAPKTLPFLLGNCMSKYYYHYNKYAEYGKLEIIGGTRDLNKHLATPRLLIRRTGSNLCATYSDKKELIESTIYFLRSEKINLKFLLGIINSKLLSFYISKRLVTNQQGFPQVLMGQLEQLPIVSLNLKSKKEKSIHDEIVKHVDNLLQLNKDIRKTKTPAQHEQIQNRISYSENNINELVFGLYGLSKKDIETIKNNLL